MVMRHALCVAIVLSGVAACAMQKESFYSNEPIHKFFGEKEYEELQAVIDPTWGRFEVIVPQIKDLAKKSNNWKEILNKGHHTEHLLHKIDFLLPQAISTVGFDRSLRFQGRYLYKELAVAVLGTPGAITCGKRYIQVAEAKTRLENFLFQIVCHGHIHGNSLGSLLEWEDEDLDVVRAALDMGIDPRIANGSTYREGYGGNCGQSLLEVAEHAQKFKIVALLRERGAVVDSTIPALITEVKFGYNEKVVDLLLKEPKGDVNVRDNYGQTPLMFAAQLGNVAIVKTLLIAKAVVWVEDADDKNALDYANSCLLNCKEEDKKKYNAIVQLLKDAGAQ